MHHFDDLDLQLLSELKKDSSISVPILSKKLGTNSSVIYSRIKRLIKKKLIKKYTIEIDDAQLGFEVKASVGINRDPKFKEQIQQSLLSTPEVAEICEITGRFDIMVTMYAKSLNEMHKVVSEKIGKIEGILGSESFIEMKRRTKPMPYMPE